MALPYQYLTGIEMRPAQKELKNWQQKVSKCSFGGAREGWVEWSFVQCNKDSGLGLNWALSNGLFGGSKRIERAE